MSEETIDPEIAALMADRQKSSNQEIEDSEIAALMKERIENDPNLSGAANNTTENNPIASSEFQVPEWLENAYGNLKNKASGVDLKDAGAIVGGGAVGLGLSNLIDEFTPIINKENEEKYKTQKDFLKTANPTEQNILKKSEIVHETKLLNLQDQQLALQSEMEKSGKALEKAKLKHELAKRINVDNFLPPEIRSTYTPPIETLTQLPIGGKAAQNYDIAHGGTEMEALLSPSTSQVQKELPERTERSIKVREVGPEFQRVAESPLLLAEEGRKAKLEELNKPPPKEDDRIQKIKESVAKKQAKALDKFEKAQAAHDANIKALSKINADLAAHQETNPATFRQQEAAQEEKNKLQAMEEWNKKYGGGNPITKGASFIARKLLPRFSPIIAGAVAPEQAIEAKRLYDKGEYGKAAAYGLGTLGSVGMATGIPVLSGLGAVAQLPSVYFEGEDLFSPPKKP